MPTYKAIVFDLDGTAIPNERTGMPSPRLINAVKEAKNSLHLIAATARPSSLALPVIQALRLSDPCIISGGTTIIDPVSGAVLREARLSQEQLDAVSQICLPYPYKVGIDDEPPEERRLVGTANILFIPGVEAKDLTNLIQALSHIPGVLATSTKAWTSGHVIHVTTRDGSKEYGIGHVLKQLNIKRDEAIGVGDGDNDVHLFAAVGHHIAMGNASDQLKSVADEIAPGIDEDGLSWVLERYAHENRTNA
jgi:hydroxymethylpyrimidine pyrophosphatase-like HAD family hydrolase